MYFTNDSNVSNIVKNTIFNQNDKIENIIENVASREET